MRDDSKGCVWKRGVAKNREGVVWSLPLPSDSMVSLEVPSRWNNGDGSHDSPVTKMEYCMLTEANPLGGAAAPSDCCQEASGKNWRDELIPTCKELFVAVDLPLKALR
jgi:hypothetical protein